MLRLTRIVSVALVVVLGGLWAFAWVGRAPGESAGEAFVRRLAAFSGGDMPAPSAGGVQLAQVALGGAFTLTDHTGRAVTEQSYAPGFSLIYFGFTFCPDVCPTELGVMSAAVELLGADSARVTPIFITVDPERDTQAVMADYVSRFDERLVGLTGTAEQVRQVARACRVYYAKVTPPNASQYLMDHSSLVYLTGPDGRVRQVFRAETGPEAMAAAIRGQLRARAS